MHSLPEYLQTLLSSTWGIVLMILFFNGSIVVHELGHYLAARWRRLKVTRFSIFGLGPKLISWRGKDGVEYCICALPFGAYVALPQLAEMKAIEGDDTGSNSDNDADDADGSTAALPPISYADKMIVAAAGPVFNVIFAAILAAIVWAIGYPQPAAFNSTTIGYVLPTLETDANDSAPSPAAAAGLKPGDKILKIDGANVSRFSQVIELIALGGGRDEQNNPQAIFTIERDGKQMDIPVQPRLVTVNDASGDQIRLTGISPQQELLIGQVLENSPAAAAGLLSGDTLLRADGTPLHSIAQLSDILEHAIGKTVAVTVLRGGQEAVLELKPESIPLTRPLAHVFVGKDATQPALEIIPLYPQARASAPAESTATATAPAAVATADAAADTTVVKSADPANPQTTAHLAVFSLPGAPALLSGLRGEWYIESVNGVRTDNIAALADALNAKNKDGNATDDLTIVTSAGARRDLVLTGGAHAEIIPPRTQALVGIILEGGAVLTYPSIANQFRQHLETTFRTLKSLFTPSSDIGVGHLSGPVGIGRAVYSLAISDIRLVLWFTVLLNLNLAILNLLPIPVLDGGHMTIATITRLRGRSLPESFIAGLQGAFMVLLLGLMIYILFKDSMRWYGDSESERAWKRQSLYAIPSRFGPPIKPADAHADAGAANANAAGAATGEADAASDNK